MTLSVFLKRSIYFVFIGVLPVCMSVLGRGNPLELGVVLVCEPHVGAGNRTRSSGRAATSPGP